MDRTQRYTIDKDKVAYRDIGGEAVILKFDIGYYYSLNEVATKIWDNIDKKKSLSEILGLLKGEYRLSEKKLKKDLCELIRDLEREELIRKI